MDVWTKQESCVQVFCLSVASQSSHHSAFAASGWAAAFGPDWPSPYQGTEQTPKDNYQVRLCSVHIDRP